MNKHIVIFYGLPGKRILLVFLAQPPLQTPAMHVGNLANFDRYRRMSETVPDWPIVTIDH